jgi:hypothetical protein
MKVDANTVVAQSKNAYNQWRDVWRKHAKEHAKFAPFKSLSDFLNVGVGRACLVIANGFSFEENIETIKKYAGNVDILCCDKTLGHLLDHGIKPTYCLVADAVVNYDKYMHKWRDQLDETILFINVCGNPKWSTNGSWKDRYFFANHDVIKSEVEFMGLSGCPNAIPAGTNVSNAMVVFLTQCDNKGRKNFFGYDKILLVGFDYCWRFGKKYYAFDEGGSGKSNYMRHVYCCTRGGEYAYTSSNLLFSAKWLEKYVNNFRLPVVQCDQGTILTLKYTGVLAEQMQYGFRAEDRDLVRLELAKRDKLLKEAQDIETRVSRIGVNHHYNFIASV